MKVYAVVAHYYGDTDIEAIFSDIVLAEEYIWARKRSFKRREVRPVGFDVEAFDVLDQLPKPESEQL